MSIEQFKKNIESEREASATKYGTKTEYSYKNTKLVSTQEIIDYDMVLSFKAGHEAATNRLLPLLEKAVEMAEFYKRECPHLCYPLILKKEISFMIVESDIASTEQIIKFYPAQDFLDEIKEEFGK